MSRSHHQNKSVIFVLGGFNAGGAERVASHLINYWYGKGWDITLIIGHGSEKDFYEIPDGIKRIVINTGSPSSNKIVALMKNLPYVWRLRKALKKNKALNVISFLTRTNVHAILACLGLKKHLIISERNDTTREEHLWPWPMLRKVLYRFADVVTANSEIALSGMKKYVPDEKLKIVRNPVFIPEEKAQPEQSTMILNVGRLVPQKAQHLIVEALSHIGKDLKGWSLYILGEGEERDRLQKMAEQKSLADRIHLQGLVENPGSYYVSSGIFVLSSAYEGTPNALLEAMSFGLPCIISDTLPGAMELIENDESGLVFSTGDAGDLAEKLVILMTNPPERTRLGQNARRKVKKLAPEYVIPAWEKLLKRSRY